MKPTRWAAWLLCGLAWWLPMGPRHVGAAAAATPPAAPAPASPAPAEPLGTPNIDFSSPDAPGDISDINLSGPDASVAAAKETRFTLGHEVSYRTGRPHGIVNDRSWFRFEYSKFFLKDYFIQLDTKLNAYWANDHRAEAEDHQVSFESSTPEAFIQYSPTGGNTSLKVGIQRLIWGESEAGAITDEISPRNLSELFFIPLEESRIGQFMLTLDHFSPAGDWTFFYVPDPRFNKLPRPGTAYYFDPFNGLAQGHDAPSGKRKGEFGMRWKKTFGKSDISFMGASLIDNNYAFSVDGPGSGDGLSVSRIKQRFSMAGATFNYAKGDFLVKGEIGLKFPKAFNDSAFQIQKRNVIDSSLGLTYSLGRSNTIGLELVNSHVREWDSGLLGVPRNRVSLVLNANLFFLNDTLSVNWLTILNRPYTSVQSSLRTSYKWSDDTTFSVDAHVLNVPDQNSPLYRYRHVDSIFFRVQHQF